MTFPWKDSQKTFQEPTALKLLFVQMVVFPENSKDKSTLLFKFSIDKWNGKAQQKLHHPKSKSSFKALNVNMLLANKKESS